MLTALIEHVETTGRGVQNRTNQNRNRKKPHMVWMYSDNFFTQPTWFGSVCGFDFTNQTKPQYKKNTKYISPRPIHIGIQWKL